MSTQRPTRKSIPASKIEKRIWDALEGWVLYLQANISDPEGDNLRDTIKEVRMIPFIKLPLKLNDYEDGGYAHRALAYRIAGDVKDSSVAFNMSDDCIKLTEEGWSEEFEVADGDDIEFLKRETDVVNKVFKELMTISEGLLDVKLCDRLKKWYEMSERICSRIFER